jgi:hypothetical protein
MGINPAAIIKMEKIIGKLKPQAGWFFAENVNNKLQQLPANSVSRAGLVEGVRGYAKGWPWIHIDRLQGL